MAASGKSRANANKEIRQKALREQLAAQGHVQHVVDLLKKVEGLTGDELNALELQKNKLVIDTKLALIKKYLPDPKQVELSGNEDAPLNFGQLTNQQLEAIIARSKS